MATLNSDAFVKAIQSPTIDLIVGSEAERITVSKALLCHKAPAFATLISEESLSELVVPDVGIDTGKAFVSWCYQVSSFSDA